MCHIPFRSNSMKIIFHCNCFELIQGIETEKVAAYIFGPECIVIN